MCVYICIYQSENARFNYTMIFHFVLDLQMGKARIRLIFAQLQIEDRKVCVLAPHTTVTYLCFV